MHVQMFLALHGSLAIANTCIFFNETRKYCLILLVIVLPKQRFSLIYKWFVIGFIKADGHMKWLNEQSGRGKHLNLFALLV